MATFQNNCPQTCRNGDKHPTVKFLQRRLNRNGCNLTADGAFGPKTFEALKNYQAKADLTADGICGPKTWHKLMNGGTKIIHYLQGDPQWKAMMYSCKNDKSQTMGNSGCGPTALAIAMSAYDVKVKPPDLAKLAMEKGYRTPSNGTAWGFFAAISRLYGCSSEQTASLDKVLSALSAGHICIASMGPDAFTKGGHYITLYDYNPDTGIVFVLDPASTLRNSCMLDVIRLQSKQFWIVKK